MTIETRPLGRTGTDVTILGYGAMELRGRPRGPAIDDEDAGRVLNAVLDGGISLIDTSIDYGRSEVIADDLTTITPASLSMLQPQREGPVTSTASPPQACL